jgi:CheY-like chemotaxis protein
MNPPMGIALLGLEPRERAAIEAFLRLAPMRNPAYTQVPQPEQAELVLVDADDDAQRARIAELRIASRCVAVGQQPLKGAALQLPRPLNVLRLFSRIDRLRAKAAAATVPAEQPPPAAPAAVPDRPTEPAQRETDAKAPTQVPTPQPTPQPVPQPTPQPVPQPVPQPTAPPPPQPTPAPIPAPRVPLSARPSPPLLAPPLMPAHERITLIGLDDDEAAAHADAPPPRRPRERTAGAASPAGPASAAGVKHVLVVDAGEEVFRFLVDNIECFGFALHRARHAAEALERVAARRFHYAFVAVDMGHEGGVRLAMQLCLAAGDRGREPPAVALFGSPQALVGALGSSSHGLAQVDAVLTLPLQRDELLDLLGGRMLQRQAFEPTSPQSTYA